MVGINFDLTEESFFLSGTANEPKTQRIINPQIDGIRQSIINIYDLLFTIFQD